MFCELFLVLCVFFVTPGDYRFESCICEKSFLSKFPFLTVRFNPLSVAGLFEKKKRRVIGFADVIVELRPCVFIMNDLTKWWAKMSEPGTP